MKIAMLCAAILSVAALAVAETTISQYPNDFEGTALKNEALSSKATPTTNFDPEQFDAATKRAFLDKALQSLKKEHALLQLPVPGENYDQAMLRQEKAELVQKRIDHLSQEVMIIQ